MTRAIVGVVAWGFCWRVRIRALATHRYQAPSFTSQRPVSAAATPTSFLPPRWRRIRNLEIPTSMSGGPTARSFRISASARPKATRLQRGVGTM